MTAGPYRRAGNYAAWQAPSPGTTASGRSIPGVPGRARAGFRPADRPDDRRIRAQRPRPAIIIAERDPGLGGNWFNAFGHDKGIWGLRFVRTEATAAVRLWRLPLAALVNQGVAADDGTWRGYALRQPLCGNRCVHRRGGSPTCPDRSDRARQISRACCSHCALQEAGGARSVQADGKRNHDDGIDRRQPRANSAKPST